MVKATWCLEEGSPLRYPCPVRNMQVMAEVESRDSLDARGWGFRQAMIVSLNPWKIRGTVKTLTTFGCRL